MSQELLNKINSLYGSTLSKSGTFVERKRAFVAGIEEFCKQAGLDAEDAAHMVSTFEKCAAPGVWDYLSHAFSPRKWGQKVYDSNPQENPGYGAQSYVNEMNDPVKMRASIEQGNDSQRTALMNRFHTLAGYKNPQGQWSGMYNPQAAANMAAMEGGSVDLRSHIVNQFPDADYSVKQQGSPMQTTQMPAAPPAQAQKPAPIPGLPKPPVAMQPIKPMTLAPKVASYLVKSAWEMPGWYTIKNRIKNIFQGKIGPVWRAPMAVGTAGSINGSFTPKQMEDMKARHQSVIDSGKPLTATDNFSMGINKNFENRNGIGEGQTRGPIDMVAGAVTPTGDAAQGKNLLWRNPMQAAGNVVTGLGNAAAQQGHELGLNKAPVGERASGNLATKGTMNEFLPENKQYTGNTNTIPSTTEQSARTGIPVTEIGKTLGTGTAGSAGVAGPTGATAAPKRVSRATVSLGSDASPEEQQAASARVATEAKNMGYSSAGGNSYTKAYDSSRPTVGPAQTALGPTLAPAPTDAAPASPPPPPEQTGYVPGTPSASGSVGADTLDAALKPMPQPTAATAYAPATPAKAQPAGPGNEG